MAEFNLEFDDEEVGVVSTDVTDEEIGDDGGAGNAGTGNVDVGNGVWSGLAWLENYLGHTKPKPNGSNFELYLSLISGGTCRPGGSRVTEHSHAGY